MFRAASYSAIVVLLVCGIVLPEYLSTLWPQHTSTANFLSELGAVGAPHAAIINWLGFLPVAVATLILLLWLSRSLKARGAVRAGLILIAIGIPSGYLIAVAFPCDLGCPVQGSARQAVHNLGGLLAYPLGAIGLALLGTAKALPKALRALSVLAGVFMALGFIMMLSPDMSPWRGAWQRLGDYSAFIALSLATWHTLRVRAQ